MRSVYCGGFLTSAPDLTSAEFESLVTSVLRLEVEKRLKSKGEALNDFDVKYRAVTVWRRGDAYINFKRAGWKRATYIAWQATRHVKEETNFVQRRGHCPSYQT